MIEQCDRGLLITTISVISTDEISESDKSKLKRLLGEIAALNEHLNIEAHQQIYRV